MADNQKVYQAIKTIADELCKENKTYLRADLAFELKKYGIASDSSEVSKLVFDAYRYFHDNGNIAIAFVSNNSRTTLVAEYKLNDSLEQGNKEEALKIAETELALSSSALEQLKEQVELNLNLVLAKGTSKMADIVMEIVAGTQHTSLQSACIYRLSEGNGMEVVAGTQHTSLQSAFIYR